MSIIADLMRAGVDPDLVARVADAIAEARALGARDAMPARTARQERNSRYYEAHKHDLKAKREASKSSEIKTVKTVSDDQDAVKTVQDVSDGFKTVSDANEASRAPAFSVGEEVNIPPEKPSVSTPKGDERNGSRSKGSRLPEGWRPNEAGRRFAVETLGSNAAAHAELAKFSDYWLAKAGADARKADWDAAWRNWVRKAAEAGPRAQGPPPRNGSLSPRMNALQELYDECADPDEHGETSSEPSWPDAPSGSGGAFGRAGGTRQ